MTSADSLTTNAVEISAKETYTAFFQVCPMKKLVHPIYGVMNPKFHQEQYRKSINQANNTALYSTHGIANQTQTDEYKEK